MEKRREGTVVKRWVLHVKNKEVVINFRSLNTGPKKKESQRKY